MMTLQDMYICCAVLMLGVNWYSLAHFCRHRKDLKPGHMLAFMFWTTLLWPAVITYHLCKVIKGEE